MKRLKFIPPIVIHPTLWFSLVVSILTGTIMEFILVFSIVLLHESGHFVAAKCFGWKIRKVMLWMFGGVMETENYSNRPIYQELIITLAGPIQHIGIFFLLYGLDASATLSPSLIQFAYTYNWTIFIFNLLPIFPLDGGKLLFAGLSYLRPFRQAHASMIVISVTITVIILGIMFYHQETVLSTYLLFAFILWENRLEWKQRFYTFIRFLLNRQLLWKKKKRRLPLIVPASTKLIDVFGQFYREQQHDIYLKNGMKVTDEQACLYMYFNLKQYQATVADVCRKS